MCTKVPGCVEDYLVKYCKFSKGLFLDMGIIYRPILVPKVSPVFVEVSYLVFISVVFGGCSR